MAFENRDPIDSHEATPREMRVDPAHPVARAEVPAALPVSVKLAQRAEIADDVSDEFGVAQLFSSGVPVEALARHASELAEKLQSRLADLDHRESTLNGQQAELDSRIRSARLWLEERESELDSREETLEQRESDLGSAPTNTQQHTANVTQSLQLEERERQVFKQRGRAAHAGIVEQEV
jgi:DNA repair exonuclease SbcCD ATPase subunit